MKKLLNTLYITEHKTSLSLRGEAVIISSPERPKTSIPLHNLSDIVICSRSTWVTPSLMGYCNRNRISIMFFDDSGRFLARVEGGWSGSVLMRQKQYRIADDKNKSSLIARNIIIGKIHNSRISILRRLRRLRETESDSQAINELANAECCLFKTIKSLHNNYPTLEELRGIEGDSARQYFQIFNHFITQQKNDFLFKGRTKRPPMDKINALLSFAYAILASSVESAVQSSGLDPQMGYLHAPRPGRASLALDIMEEFRAMIADRIVLNLINMNRLQADRDFETSKSGAVSITQNAKKIFFSELLEKKKEEIFHPLLGESVAIGLLPFVQSRFLARYIRGDLSEYPPFLWK